MRNTGKRTALYLPVSTSGQTVEPTRSFLRCGAPR